MKKCDVCWGIFHGEECPFGKTGELPWAEDYSLMRKGKLNVGEQQRNVARWVLHGSSEHSESILHWAKNLMQEQK